MGRDWYWSSSKKQERQGRQGEEEPSPPPGCMSGVLNLFDFHQFQFPITHRPCFKPNSIPQEDPTSVKGVAAPRNSLESDGITLETSSVSTELKQEDFHDTGEMKIVATRRIDEVSCSDSSSSPGAKTPSLVARLMGLDLLPDTSPSPSSSKPFSGLLRKDHQLPLAQPFKNKHKSSSRNVSENEMSGSRSLPDTPRISSARRSDVDARFSLQINKENMNAEEFDHFTRISKDRRSASRDFGNVEENSSSPGHYARQIVKQVKESVSRRVVGLDITNTTNNKLKSKEVDVVLLKSKKPKRLTKIGEESTVSKSPRPRLCEIIDQASITPKPRSPPSGPPQIPMQSEFSAKQKPKLQRVEKCKKASCERYAQRREACAVRGSKPRRKKPQLTKEIATVSTESALPLTSLSHDYQLQVSKPSCSSRTWSDRHNNNSINDRTCTDFGDEIWYVSEILKCTEINKDTIVSFARWYSPSHPLDPSIFHNLENSAHVGGSLQHRCNRRLIFNLIDELLSNLIKPYLNMKPWIKQHEAPRREMRGDALLRGLCSEITRLPSLDCQTLEDIDSLIDKDLPDTKIRRLPIYEETESIVFEIEQDILESLVHETADDVIHQMRIHVTRCI